MIYTRIKKKNAETNKGREGMREGKNRGHREEGDYASNKEVRLLMMR